jgi:hypothetical protein
LELSRWSLRVAAAEETAGHAGTVSSTMLHEIGHSIGSGTYGPSVEAYKTFPAAILGNIPVDVPAHARDPERKALMERYAQAYMIYFGGSDRRLPQGLTPDQRQAMSRHFGDIGIPVEQSRQEQRSRRI